MTTPKVSIVTPLFDQAQFLTQTLESVRGQDHPNIEHVVVDGGLTGGSVEISREAPGIRWLSEAMGDAMPVIVSRVGGLRHMVCDGITGFLFQSGNPTELADKMQSLLEDESVRRQFGEARRKHALKVHHPDRVAQLTRGAYDEILGRR